MTRTERFQKVLERYEAFRKANGITGYYETRPYWTIGTDGWMICERTVEMTSKGNCERVDCGDLVEALKQIPGVVAQPTLAYDGTYGFAFKIA